MKFSYPVKFEAKDNNGNITIPDLDNLNEYDLTKGSSATNLDIVIDGDQIVRYSCCNHKLNLALQHAFQ